MACGGFGCRHDALGLGEEQGGAEDLVLLHRLGGDEALVEKGAHDGGGAVVAEAPRVHGGGHEVVAQGVHLHDRGELGRVAVVEGELALREARAGGGLHGDGGELLTRRTYRGRKGMAMPPKFEPPPWHP